MYLNPWRTGLAFGGLIGLWHLVWAACVAFGVAQPLMDFILYIHFVQVPAHIAPFSAATALMLVIIATGFSFLFGALFACVWNWLLGDGATRRRQIPAL